MAISPDTRIDGAVTPAPAPAARSHTDERFSLTPRASHELDLLRAFASQLVVVGHAISMYGVMLWAQPPRAPWMQDIAVVVFFLLSGFIIAFSTFTKVERRAGYDFGDFVIDRFARIYTAFVPGLVLVFVADVLTRSLAPGAYEFASGFSTKRFIENLFMLQGHPLLPIVPFGSGRPLWTVAVEWWIYLAFGWWMLANMKTVGRLRWLLVSGALSIVPVAHLVGGRGNGLTLVWIYGAIALSLVKTRLGDTFGWSAWRALALGCIACAAVRVGTTKEAYDPLFAGILALGLFCALRWWSGSPYVVASWWTRTVQVLASYSYSLYLVHYSLLYLLHRVPLPLSGGAKTLIGITGANVVAILMAMAFERHYRGVGRWLRARRAALGGRGTGAAAS